MTTITANSTISIELTSPSYSNPVVVDPGVLISATGAGIIAPSGAWTIQNGGVVEGTEWGVFLEVSAGVTNQITGRIDGVFAGIESSDALTVMNAGYIGGTQTGINLYAGGSIFNQSTGTISAVYSAIFSRDTLTIVNAGSIFAGSGFGVYLAGGYINNQSLGTISGAAGASAGLVTAVNGGLIRGFTAYGFGLSGGNITNQSGGTIIGLEGIVGGASIVTVVNAGSIIGTTQQGILLDTGGSVTNQSTGTIISTGSVGVEVIGAPGTVFNAGVIMSESGTHTAAILFAGGYLQNAITGTIGAGGNGVYISGGAGTVINAGSIISSAGDGVVLEGTGGGTLINTGIVLTQSSADHSAVFIVKDAGYVGNELTGTISSNGGVAVYMTGGVGSVVNAGTIVSAADVGVDFHDVGGGTLLNTGVVITTGNTHGAVDLFTGGLVSNAATGTIASHGGTGVYVTGGIGTVINAGSIGGAVYAVHFTAGFADRVVINPGAIFSGKVTGGNSIGATASSTLELSGGPSAGTISGLGSAFVDFSQIIVDPGATWSLSGVNTIVAGQTLTVTSATLNDSSSLLNNGAIQLDPSTMTVAGLTGIGTVNIAADSTLSVLGTISPGETIGFTGSGGDLILGTATAAAGTIAAFGAGDTIDLASLPFVPGATATVTGGILSVNSGGTIDTLLLPGFADGTSFIAGLDASSFGTDIVLCFLPGTLIRTEQGDVAVETLKIGDRVVTVSGQARPLSWIGHGKALATRWRRNAATPVIVRKGALADNVPYADLRITKGHSLYIDGVLIPAEFLVNHRSIQWDDRAQEVAVYHLELDSHDVLIANGAAAESYRDDGNRWLFRNANPGWNKVPKPSYAPVLTGGPEVDAIWRRLLDRSGPRAGLPLTDDPDLHLIVDGQRLDAPQRVRNSHVFTLSQRPRAVSIASRAVVPQEVGFARDPRCLGVALKRLAVQRGAEFEIINASDPRFVDGFHEFETEPGFRWTNGNADLPAELFEGCGGPMEIVVTIGETTHYIEEGVRQRVA